MAATLRVFRRRIRSVQTTKKITKAMELIASSRVVRAQQRVAAALPYAQALLRAVEAAAAHVDVDHPLTSAQRLRQRAAVVLITSDRGLAGAYNANAIREAEALTRLLREQGKDVVPYLIGRKASAYYRFRGREIAAEWTGMTEAPSYTDARTIADRLLADFLRETEDGGLDEIHVVYTYYRSMGQQDVRVRRVLPLEVVDDDQNGAATTGSARRAPYPLYEFEPSAEEVLDALLPRFVANVFFTMLLLAAASEWAARMRAMKSASDNAEELIRSYTRAANAARQAEITQEISEIVGGANALATSASE